MLEVPSLSRALTAGDQKGPKVRHPKVSSGSGDVALEAIGLFQRQTLERQGLQPKEGCRVVQKQQMIIRKSGDLGREGRHGNFPVSCRR